MPGAWRPYFFVGYNSIVANATESVEFSVGATEEFEGKAIRIHATSVGFDVIRIADQGGTPYTNASSTSVIDGNLLTAATKNEFAEIELAEPLNLGPNSKLTVDITDTSGSTNELWVLLIGKMRSV